MRLGVVSWNINRLSKNLEQLPNLISTDVPYWIIQLIEAKSFSQKEILEQLPQDYYSINLPDEFDTPQTSNISGIKLVTNLPPGTALLIAEEKRSIAVFLQFEEKPIMYYGLHLPSKYNEAREEVQSDYIRDLIPDLLNQYKIRYQKKLSFQKDSFIFCGDFNLNLYEMGMVHNRGFHASSSIDLVGHERERRNRSQHLPLLYNPFWGQMGDYVPHSGEPKLPGSYFYKNPQVARDYHWHMLDGALFSYAAAKMLEVSTVQVLPLHEQMGLNFRKFIDEYSDHFPIRFVLEV